MKDIEIQNTLEKNYVSLIKEQDYEGALKLAETLCLLDPQNPEYSHKIAYVYLQQLKWEDAINAELETLKLNDSYIPALDLLAHAYGGISNWERAGFYGHLSLTLKDKAIPVPEQEMIPASCPKGSKRIISFSLFGNNSKYVEPAVLNTQVSPILFPGWICRFYVDDSVSETAIQRLKNNGAEVINISEPLDKWPGPMWRFLAINDPEAEYVIFRDADSVISHREAMAVAEWIESGRAFHTMRDSGSHTALILAGMWGAKAGSVPDMQQRIQRFIDRGYDSSHFADQDFLAEELWGYIRQDLLAHDRVFNFCNPKPFPGHFEPSYQIAHCEGASVFNAETSYKDGSKIRWTLYSQVSPLVNPDYSFIRVPEFKVCSYEDRVKNGSFNASIPRRYGFAFSQGLARIDIEQIID